MQALEQGPAAETPDQNAASSAAAGGAAAPGREPVPVMDPGAVGPRTEDREAVAVMAAVGSADPDAPAAAAAAETAPLGNVAVRVIRALTSRTSASGHPEGQ